MTVSVGVADVVLQGASGASIGVVMRVERVKREGRRVSSSRSLGAVLDVDVEVGRGRLRGLSGWNFPGEVGG